jgi:hypothetical protein
VLVDGLLDVGFYNLVVAAHMRATNGHDTVHEQVIDIRQWQDAGEERVVLGQHNSQLAAHLSHKVT